MWHLKNKFLKGTHINEICTIIAGYQASIRTRINNGIAMKTNAYVGYSERIMGNFIIW